MSDQANPHPQSPERSEREQLVLVGKIALGAVVGILMVGVVGPIVLAVVVGLATGHR